MKKIAVLVILCLFAVEMVNAQKREVTRANRQLNRGNIEQAFEHIQNAVTDASTKNDAATWVTHARIMIEIATAEDPAIGQLAEKPLDIAFESINKAEKLDVNNLNYLDIQQTLLVLSEAFFNEGAIAYNDEAYARASNAFFKSYKVSESFGSIDTATLYNAGLSAEIAGLFDEAYDLYAKTAEYEYDQPFLYSSLAGLSLRKQDFEQAEEWISKGRALYPENLDLIFAEANVHLTSGNIPEARRVLELAIERDPENANLHYAFAVNFDQMSKDTVFSKEEREFAYGEAIKSYKKAIELREDYFDAIYNLGALYFNQGIQLFLQADNILRGGYTTENLKKSSALEEKSKEVWSENAQPYLEEALTLIDEDDDNYEIVLRSLRELYMRTGQNEKLEETNQIWKEKFGGPEEE
ncbi:MAG: tetratricopeptide repeat protein [Bacteroidetes bacterium]|nr:MAG: tetratricopeptide repeat protein [Bacteroidota bacterium]